MKPKLLITLAVATVVGLGILSYFLNWILWLPPGVSAPRGKVSLVADFAGAKSNSISLYLINRTSRSISLPAQDGDVYIKMETLDDGTWKRAQKHLYSWCGNSYHTITLRPGSFLKFAGYHPPSGQDREVRYKLYGEVRYGNTEVEIVSNSGRGKVDLDEIRIAAGDTMAIYRGSFDFLSDIVRKRIILTPLDHNKPRVAALHALARQKRPETVTLLLETLNDESLEDDELSRAWISLMEVDKTAATTWTLEALKNKNHKYRQHIVSNAWRLGEPSLIQIFEAILEDYADPGFLNAAANYVALNPEEAKPRIEQLLADPELPAGHRDQLRQILNSFTQSRGAVR